MATTGRARVTWERSIAAIGEARERICRVPGRVAVVPSRVASPRLALLVGRIGIRVAIVGAIDLLQTDLGVDGVGAHVAPRDRQHVAGHAPPGPDDLDAAFLRMTLGGSDALSGPVAGLARRAEATRAHAAAVRSAGSAVAGTAGARSVRARLPRRAGATDALAAVVGSAGSSCARADDALSVRARLARLARPTHAAAVVIAAGPAGARPLAALTVVTGLSLRTRIARATLQVDAALARCAIGNTALTLGTASLGW